MHRPIAQRRTPLARVLALVLAALVGAISTPTDAAPRKAQGKGHTGARAAAREATPGRGRKPKAGKRGKKKGSARAQSDAPGASRRAAPPETRPAVHLASLPRLGGPIHCPDDMVAVAGRVCVDRYESSLGQAGSGEPLSPYYPPSRELATSLFETWSRARDEAPEGTLARTMPVPPPFGFAGAPIRPMAASRVGAVPSGYVSGVLAGEACRAAGKRLCKATEWITACRGEAETPYPYGATYRQGACNVFREEHPAHLLHGTFSLHHQDPRLNEIGYEGQPLLRATGDTPACVSRWGDDGIVDMVGNLDEWIDDPEGTFLGGFYSRATRAGCDARIGGHPIEYFDYSTGVRCCADPVPAAGAPTPDPGG